LIRFEIILAVISLAGNGRRVSFPDSPEKAGAVSILSARALMKAVLSCLLQ
jgi:hypothetical protein